MSIVRTALRIAVRKAIENRTMAQDRIMDSSITTLENALQSGPAPVVLIYTDDSIAKPSGKAIWDNGTIDIVLLVSVSGALVVQVPSTDPEAPPETFVEFHYPETDAASELSIDLIERQIKRELTNPDNPWGHFWRRLVVKVEEWKSTRGSSTKEGIRFAARQIIIRVEAIEDPVPDGDMADFWKEFVEAIEADDSEEWGTVPALLRATIEGRPVDHTYRAAMHEGWSMETTRKVGLGSVSVVLDGDPLQVEGYAVTGLKEGDPGV